MAIADGVLLGAEDSLHGHGAGGMQTSGSDGLAVGRRRDELMARLFDASDGNARSAAMAATQARH
jgi:hypothetical protein